MYCSKCGSKMQEHVGLCHNCGNPLHAKTAFNPDLKSTKAKLNIKLPSRFIIVYGIE